MKTQSFIRFCGICITAVLISAAISLNAAVWTVTSLADSGPGSLRAQVLPSAPGDTIQFAVTGTILLSSSVSVSHTLTIQGPGPSALTIDAGGVDRAFVVSGNPVILSGMTISNGLVAGTPGANGLQGQDGGAGGNVQGGAILDTGGVGDVLILSNCWITLNTARGGNGGRGGDNPTFTNHSINGGGGGSAEGGAVWTGGIVSSTNCTFSNNHAIGGRGGDGGSADNFDGGIGGSGGEADGGALTGNRDSDINCTFSGNTASGGAGGNGGTSFGFTGGAGGPGNNGVGGAINHYSSELICCTVISNSAFAGAGGAGGNGFPSGANGADGAGSAGGIYGFNLQCLSSLANTILADNYADTLYTNYYVAWIDNGYNFIGSADIIFCSIGSTTVAGTVATPIHPQLGPLAQNGGGVPTHATTLTSPVTDQGKSFGLTTDERGAPRPYIFSTITEPTGGDGSDIGAFELGSADLGMSMSGGKILLSWPVYYGNFTVQSATSLLGSHNWSYLSVTPVQVGSQLVVTNPMTNAIMFYRLISK